MATACNVMHDACFFLLVDIPVHVHWLCLDYALLKPIIFSCLLPLSITMVNVEIPNLPPTGTLGFFLT